jgi:uncharacterized glyoxalase superfamily protein PhnB
MSDTTGPGGFDGTGTGADPFRQLRLPVTPLAPRPAFGDELRRRIEAALLPDPTPTSDPEVTMSTTDTSTADATSTTAGADPAMARREKPVLSPYLAVPRAAEAIDWYRDVLGAVETTRFVGDDGRVGHCELVIAGSVIMLADEFPEMGVKGPGAYGGTPVMLHLELADVDYTYQRAIDSGAEGQRPPADQGHGNRNATIVDPFGHRWMLSQPLPSGETTSTAADDGADATGGSAAGGDDADQTVTTDAGGSWKVSGRAPVEPGYLTINPTDPVRASEFFSALFAWDLTHSNPDGSGHVGNTRFPLGIASAQFGADAGHGATTVYFRVDDPEHYAQLVEQLGGRVLARKDYDSGASITCEDDQGYRFELWQPASGY